MALGSDRDILMLLTLGVAAGIGGKNTAGVGWIIVHDNDVGLEN